MVEAATTTTTLDDADSSVFTFASAWNSITPQTHVMGGSTALLEFEGTIVVEFFFSCGQFIELTRDTNPTRHLSGSGVTLYGVTNADHTSTLRFILDGGSPVNLDLSSIPQSPTAVYNYQFFSASGLSSGFHILSWTIESNVSSAVALIDYAIVTSDGASSPSMSQVSSSPSSTSSSSSSASSSFPTQKSKPAATTIVDAVLGSVAGVALVAVIVFLLVRRRRKSTPSSISGLESFRFDNNLDSQLTLENGTRRENIQNTPALYLPVQGQVRDTEEYRPQSRSPHQAEVHNTNTANTANTTDSTNSPSESLASSEPIRQLEQRIHILEQMLRQADHADLALYPGSPPPYLLI
ncbi:hypothetical protein C8R41DRAFT_921136 [Lentinula lateritia]|uniref:Transmembrane protein n=1 Tax=Lentinula lateritia TaxID=40482 RepID=A0ABQ8VC96_9AGAR|nr:hypothetical protein C8R41DRAFT_921136 [Lentinula lateritia]